MKRFFAILLAAMVLPSMLLTGCSEKGEVAVEEITATEAVTEEVTTVTTEEETTVSVTETTVVTAEEAEESTTAETTVETVEDSTTADNSEQTIIFDNLEYRLANHEELLGGWTDAENEVFYVFEENRISYMYGEFVEYVDGTIVNGDIISDCDDLDVSGKIAVRDGQMYLLGVGYGPTVLERYEPIIKNDFTGKYVILTDNEYFETYVELENGVGTADNGFAVEIVPNGNKVSFTFGDKSAEYTYYIYDGYIYLFNESEVYVEILYEETE